MENKIFKIIKEKIKKEPLILAHHPFCEPYKNHTIKIRGINVCIGCLFVYPTALLSIIILKIFSSYKYYSYLDLFIMAFIFFFLNLLRKLFLKNLESKKINIIFRIILGLSLGFAISAILLSSPFKTRIILLIITIGIMIVYNVYNGIKTLKTCKNCKYYQYFPKCPGSNFNSK